MDNDSGDDLLPRWRPWLFGVGIAVLICAVSAIGLLAVRRDREARRLQQAAIVWVRINEALSRRDSDAVAAQLSVLDAVSPTDTRAARLRQTLASGEADAMDQPAVRLLLNDHVRHNRLDAAAREASKRIQVEPHDWQARCVLAQVALRQGDRRTANEHFSALPSIANSPELPTPGVVLHALELARALGRPTSELTSHIVKDILPAVRNSLSISLAIDEKVQIICCYAATFVDRDLSSRLLEFWVPVAQLARQVADDSASTAHQLTGLGTAQERLLGVLIDLRQHGKISATDGHGLQRELEGCLARAWSRAIEQAPGTTAAYVGQVRAACRRTAWTEATTIYERGLRASDQPAELVAAAAYLFGPQRSEPRLDLAERALLIRPDDSSLWLLAADAALAAGQADKALADSRRARDLRPTDSSSRWMEARAALELHRPMEALTALEPMRADPLFDAGRAEILIRALCEAGAASAADEKLSSIVDGGVLIGGVKALLTAQQFEAAARWAKEVTRRQPGNWAAWLLLGDALRSLSAEPGGQRWKSREAHAAIEAYERVLLLDPTNLTAANNLAWVWLEPLASPEQALKAIGPLRRVELSTNVPPEMLETLGSIYLAVGQIERATRLLERAVGSPVPRPMYLLRLASAYRKQGRSKDAQACLVQAAEMPLTPVEVEELRRLRREFGD
ncbi:MAG: tetratricopeptide repeat protein [Gemmataceae bacterium]